MDPREAEVDLESNWIGEVNAAILDEDAERNRIQVKRNQRIRSVLQGRRDLDTLLAQVDLPEIAEVPDSSREDRSSEKVHPPWFVARDEPRHVGLRLHEELLDLTNFLRLSPVEVAARRQWVAVVKVAAMRLWRDCKVLVFGSTATGLGLPSADLDLSIVEVPVRTTTALKQLAEHLLEIGEVSKLEIIQSAKVPVMKIQHRRTGLWADIVINRTDGSAAVRFIREQLVVFPALPPLVLFLKLFLMQRGLHETYMGGMGSYLLVCVVISFLQRHPSTHSQLQSQFRTSLGNLLLDFFRHYGQEFQYATTGISVKDGGSLFDRAARGMTATTRNGLPTLCLESPSEPGVDIGARVFRIGAIRAAFNHAYQVLSRSILGQEPPEDSLLCPQLLQLQHPVIARRYQLIEEQPFPILAANAPDAVEEDLEEQEPPEPPSKRARITAEQPPPPEEEGAEEEEEEQLQSGDLVGMLTTLMASEEAEEETAPAGRVEPFEMWLGGEPEGDDDVDIGGEEVPFEEEEETVEVEVPLNPEESESDGELAEEADLANALIALAAQVEGNAGSFEEETEEPDIDAEDGEIEEPDIPEGEVSEAIQEEVEELAQCELGPLEEPDEGSWVSTELELLD